MSAQQMTFAPMNQMTQPTPAPPHRDRELPPPAPVWLQRLSVAVLVLFCIYIGGVLAYIPWVPRLWDYNGWLLAHPSLHEILNHGWVRGLVSGIGLIDIWIGISELLHYRDVRA